MHYLLRKKPYNVMWSGNYIKDFETDDEEPVIKSLFETMKLIEKNKKLWKRIDVWDKAGEVKYKGYLLNHTKKLAVNLANYYKQSKSLDNYKEEVVIDIVPVLTETGGGIEMALFEGCSAETTEKLSGTWCGDLLQIVDELPKRYKIINCCFAEIWYRATYCYFKFGIDKGGYLLKNKKGERYQCTKRDFLKYFPAMYIKAKEQKEEIIYSSEFVDESKNTGYCRLRNEKTYSFPLKERDEMEYASFFDILEIYAKAVASKQG
jgi:hypothetical protein